MNNSIKVGGGAGVGGRCSRVPRLARGADGGVAGSQLGVMGGGRGSALSRRVAAWRVWVDAYRGMAGAGRGKHKISKKEVPPCNGRWGVFLGGGLGGFGGAPASPLVRMWINLILGSISLHVTLNIF